MGQKEKSKVRRPLRRAAASQRRDAQLLTAKGNVRRVIMRPRGGIAAVDEYQNGCTAGKRTIGSTNPGVKVL